MNHCVPDFGIVQDEHLFPAFNRRVLGDTGGDELAEIVWQKGPVLRRTRTPVEEEEPPFNAAAGIPEEPCELFMGEDELASWLHHREGEQVDDGSSVQWTGLQQMHMAMGAPAPVVEPQRQGTALQPRVDGTRRCVATSRQSTVVESSATPAASEWALQQDSRGVGMVSSHEPYDIPMAAGSSSGGGGPHLDVDDKKRKARQSEQSDDEAAEHDFFDKKRDARRPTRRTRAAEVHNLSERRRRDRINEKMKALQQLIPRCNKSDKASMLDDAVEYLKSLQLQIQMMSMGCTMPPMMFPGIAQCPPHMGMHMGMGMEPNASCMACPILPFPPVMQGSPIAGSSAAHLGAGMPLQSFRPAPMFVDGQSTSQPTGQPSDSSPSMFPMQGQNPAQVMNIPAPYLQYFGLQQMQQHHQDQGASKSPNIPRKQPASSNQSS